MSQSNNYFKNFVNDHKFTFVASIASILGLGLGLITIFPPNKRPFYSVKSFNLINNSSSTIENLEIKYKVCNDNQQESECQLKGIESLTVTKIFFWNGGRIKIDKTDVDDNPITIVASNNNTILDTKVIHISNKRTDFRLEPKSNTIIFDFLDSSNGGVIQVIHTGSSDQDISLDAYVEDSKFDGEIKQEYLLNKSDNFIVIGLYLILFLFIVSTIYNIIDIQKSRNKIKTSDLKNSKTDLLIHNIFIYWMSSIIIILMLLLIIAMVQLSLKRLTLRYPISSYEVFNSEITK